MSMTFGGWRYSGHRTRHVRPETVTYHEGDRHDFLRRCHKAIAKAVQRGKPGVRELAPYVLKWATDPRNFRAAWEHARGGGESPGPNGRRYEDYEEHDIWNLARVMQRAVLLGMYRPGPERMVPIHKTGKRGHRLLALQDIEDRAMARAFQQVLEPLLDPFFDNYVFGSRPGRSREQALALAEHLTLQEGRHVWVVADIRNAFDNVPTGRLLDVLRKWLPDEALISALANIIQRQGRRGIRQGSPLSPFLLDAYLDHFLERKWRKRFPHTPLLRAVDDMLVLCASEQEAHEAWSGLTELLVPAGMPLKGTPGQAIRDLASGREAVWLGYALQLGEGRLEARIAKKAWKKLEENLARAHAQPDTPLMANMALSGWISQLGPCYTNEDHNQATARVVSMAQRWAIDEIPSSHDLQGRWQRAYARWRRLRRGIMDGAGATCGGFARHVDFSALPRRSDGAPSGVPSLPFLSSEEVVLYTDACRAIVLSGESGRATLQSMARRICKAKGVTLDEAAVHWGFSLPRLAVPGDLARLKASVKAIGARVVFIDPLYLALLDGSHKIEATNLYQVGPVLRRAATACLEGGATPVFVHHTTKGAANPKARKGTEEGPGDPDLALDLYDLAYAGIGEFARQWLLVRHRRPYRPGTPRHELLMTIGGSAGHSGLWRVDLDEGVLDERFEGQDWQICVSPSLTGLGRDSEEGPSARRGAVSQ